jgi:hypothetical protein
VTLSLTNIYAYLTEFHVSKLYLKYVAKSVLVKAVLDEIHKLELGLPNDGTNILVIKQSSEFRIHTHN